MQKAIGIAALACFAAQAQAQTTPIEPALLASYSDKTLAIVTHAPPKVGLMTWDQVGATVAIPGIGVLGAAILSGLATGARDAAASGTRTHGAKLRELSFLDPASGITQALTAALKARLNMPIAPEVGMSSDNTLDSAIASAPGAQWLLEVRTNVWGVTYFPTDWSHYRITYLSNLRVIDAETKRIVAESTCETKQGETRRPNIEQLATKDASLLRFYFQQAQFECADRFAAKVFGFPALPRPADALTDYRDNLAADDETAVPDLPKAGQDDYKAWLAMNGPKAFAVGDTIKWGRGVGMKPTDPAAPIDVAMRALYFCKRSYKQNCKLYAVNGKVVEGSDYAGRMAAVFEKGSTAPKAPTLDTAGNPDVQSQAAHVTPTGFAKVGDYDLVPYLSDKGRTAYKAWLSKPGPKAFSISPAGYYAESVGTKPTDATMPTDPVERSLIYCNKYSPVPCTLYAVNGDVVFTLEW